MDDLVDVLGFPKAFDMPAVKDSIGAKVLSGKGISLKAVITNRKQGVGMSFRFLQSGHRIVFIQLNFTAVL